MNKFKEQEEKVIKEVIVTTQCFSFLLLLIQLSQRI